MPSPTQCSRCGAALRAGEPTCPRCLFEFAVRDGDVKRSSEPPPVAVEPDAIVPPTLEEVARALPQFQELALLGRGGMGSVFRARETALDRFVAIKVLPRALGEHADFRERFLRETRALARLNHPNVVTVHGAGEAEGLCYLVMEHVDGRNLRERMRAGGLDAGEALRIVRELCDALQYTHDEGVVHRDIKPENVLLDRTGRVKLADFGLAKLVDATPQAHLTRTDQVMGTPHYMAPEQLERPHEVDHRADLFALGVILYELLTGALPRGAFDPPSRRVGVDVRLDEIVLKALEHEPARRYQHALEVKGDVEGLERPRHEPAAKPVTNESAALDPTFVVAFVAFLLVWILTGWAWNHGPVPLGLVAIAQLGVLFALVRFSLRREPALRAVQRGGALVVLARVVPGLVAAAAGLLAIVLGHIAVWEAGVSHWHPAHRGDHGLAESWIRQPWGLVRFCGLDPTVAGDPVVSIQSSSTSTFLGEPIANHGLAVIAVGMLFVLLAARALLDPNGVRELGGYAWKRAGELGTANALALLALWTLGPWIAGRGDTSLSAQTLTLELEAPPAQVSEALVLALQDSGLELDTRQHALLVDQQSGRTTAEAFLFRAAPPSIFDAWSTSWTGARRTQPRVWATIGGTERAQVRIDAGLYGVSAEETAVVEALFDRVRDRCAPR